MMIFGISVISLWVIVGIILIVIEFTNTPNVGFLFLGLGALSTAIFLTINPITFKYQYIIFGLSSVLSFIILWWPLKQYVYKSNSKDLAYSDMIGNEVVVHSKEISAEKIGQVIWSGTIMNAKLDSKEHNTAHHGEKLHITKVSGNVLICSKVQ